MLRKSTVVALAACCTLLLTMIGAAHAHKVSVFAYAENGTIFTESYFPDGKPVEEGTIEVYDQAKNKLLEGKTDREGKFSFPIPKKEDLTIVINASMGHRNEYVLKKDEM
jgi:nickel transport protein